MNHRNLTVRLDQESVGGILQAAYDSEINVRMSWAWDAGVEAFVETLDSAGETWKYRKRFLNNDRTAVTDAVQWIAETIMVEFPDSEFTKKLANLRIT